MSCCSASCVVPKRTFACRHLLLCKTLTNFSSLNTSNHSREAVVIILIHKEVQRSQANIVNRVDEFRCRTPLLSWESRLSINFKFNDLNNAISSQQDCTAKACNPDCQPSRERCLAANLQVTWTPATNSILEHSSCPS